MNIGRHGTALLSASLETFGSMTFTVILLKSELSDSEIESAIRAAVPRWVGINNFRVEREDGSPRYEVDLRFASGEVPDQNVFLQILVSKLTTELIKALDMRKKGGDGILFFKSESQ